MSSFVAAEDLKAGDTHEDVIREKEIKECKYFRFRFIRKAVKQRAWKRFDGKTCRYSYKSIELQGIPGFQ
ncbi:MAG: hypothetical protein O8C61_10375 [Candidatus Methanoperedens sp.]|nr:hypothetical protein [Candidatus Methanoperedens sp.]